VYSIQHYASLLGRFFSPVSPTYKTDRHDIAEILLKVALSTIKPTSQPTNISGEATKLSFEVLMFDVVLQRVRRVTLLCSYPYSRSFREAIQLRPKLLKVKSKLSSTITTITYSLETQHNIYIL
jgi:hypothetical protein